MNGTVTQPSLDRFARPHAYAGVVTAANVVTRRVMVRRGIYGRQSPVYRVCTQWRVRIATDCGVVVGGFVGGMDGGALPTVRVGDRVRLDPFVLGARYADGAICPATCHQTLRGKIVRDSSNMG